MISRHTSTDKNPWAMAHGWTTAECTTLAELGWLVLASTWAPVVWRGGRRLESRFLSSDFLALDFDAPQFTLAHARRAFAGMNHLIGLTRNSMREKNGVICERFRVVVPWSTRIDSLEVYRHNVARALVTYDHADEHCCDGAHPFFACREIVTIEEGEPWDVEPAPKREPLPLRTRSPRGYLSASTRALLDQPIPPGSIHNALYKLGCALARAGATLEETLALARGSVTLSERSGGLLQRHLKTVGDGYERAVRDDAERQKRGASLAGAATDERTRLR